MKKFLISVASVLLLSSCAQDPYHLDIANHMSGAHGQSVYYRSNMRTAYAGQIRRVLSNKFKEMGIKPATSAEIADYIAIFDIETFYKQAGDKFNPAAFETKENAAVLFSDAEDDDESLGFSGNANMAVDYDKTCFTLKMGPKGTSKIAYSSSFCANGVRDTEEMLPVVLDVYDKYATYQWADVGVRCMQHEGGDVFCSAINDRQQEFFKSLWIERNIAED